MAMFLSVAKIFRPQKSTEKIYESTLINTEPSHIKSRADLDGKENVTLVGFFFFRAAERFQQHNLPNVYESSFFYHHGFSKQNIKFFTVKHFYALTADIKEFCDIYTTLNNDLNKNYLFTNSERLP